MERISSEFIEGRGQCIQALYKNQIYSKHSGNTYRCYIKACHSLVTLDTETSTVTKEPTAHLGHEPLSECRITVALMKIWAKNESTVKISTIYSDGLNHLTSAGYAITDINAPLIGGFLTFLIFRGLLTTNRASVVPTLPVKLSDIDFDLELYKKYTLTNEKKLFLQFDNKCPTRRILVFMSKPGIDWLRDSLRDHGDGTFLTAPVFFFQFYVLFGQKNTMILPCVYAALPDKTTSTYIELIHAIKLIVKPLADPLNTSLPHVDPYSSWIRTWKFISWK